MMSDDGPSNEDKALFRTMMRDVTPLKNRKKISTQPHQPSQNRSGKRHLETNDDLPKNLKKRTASKPLEPLIEKKSLPPLFSLSNVYNKTVSSEETISFCASNLPTKRFQQLKKGQIPFQSVLDLHGLNVDRARESLCHFILKESSRNTSCILIIHGKGSLRGEEPVIKNHTNHWLRQIPQILAFHSAQPKHGGSGAVYVLLTRNKSSM